MPSEQEMRAAIAARDKTCDGRFFYAVVTTGVFLPALVRRATRLDRRTCGFFGDTDSASGRRLQAVQTLLANGYPTGSAATRRASPEYIEAHAEERLTLDGLAKRVALSPSRFQRVFKAAFGVSPKAYQDAVRMKRFKAALKEGDDITGAIFSAGFGSISRVYGERARNIGMTPKAYRAGGAGETIATAWRNTALGTALMGATERGVCFVQFGKDKETLLEQLRGEFPNAELIASDAQEAPELDRVGRGAGCAPGPGRALDPICRSICAGTAFQMKVWRFLLSVREGEVVSYGELATQIEAPRAARAVASACAANRIAVLVPCHRVLRGDGSLGGYRWGLKRKRALLDAERSGKAASP